MFFHSKLALIISTLLINYPVFASNENRKIFAPTIRLSDGHLIPVLGIGTSKAKAAEGEQAVKDAIDIGYRHIDTAYIYGNEVEVGNAIRAKIAEGVIKREDIFVTTKLWCTFHEKEQVPLAFQRSLDNLNITYIDLYLMHVPIAYKQISKSTSNLTALDIDDTIKFPKDNNGKSLSLPIDYLDTWKAMEDLVDTRSVRS